MSRLAAVDLFAEDRAHEELLRPMVARLAADEEIRVTIRVLSARGGHGRVLQELDLYQKTVEIGAFGGAPPDLLVVATDGNCSTFASRRSEVAKNVRLPLADRLVVACPDPHVERWYLADPDSFHSVVGLRPAVARHKCERDYYKKALASAVRKAGHPSTLGGVEFARELAEAMDLYRAGKNDHSLGSFITDLRAKIRQIHG